MSDNPSATPDEVIAGFTPGEQVDYRALLDAVTTKAGGINPNRYVKRLERLARRGRAPWARRLMYAHLVEATTQLLVDRKFDEIAALLNDEFDGHN